MSGACSSPSRPTSSGSALAARIAAKVQEVVDSAPLGTVVSHSESADGGRYTVLTYGGEHGKREG